MDKKAAGERKITLKDYIPLLKKTFDETSVKNILKLFSETLPCSNCKQMLPLENFANSRVNKARMKKFTVCRICHRDNYNTLKGML